MFGSPASDAARLEKDIQRATQNAGQGKVSVDLGEVANLVRKRKKGAVHFVDTLCREATATKNRLQMAQLVALAYSVAFEDDALITKVSARASALGVGVG